VSERAFAIAKSYDKQVKNNNKPEILLLQFIKKLLLKKFIFLQA
jgi:hypothetical protein